MPLVNMTEMLQSAKRGQYAVANLDAYNSDFLMGYIQAAERLRAPLIVAFVVPFSPICRFEWFADMTRRAADQTPVPVALHLDHGRDIDEVMLAIRNGFTSVMVDGSRFELEENIALTRRVVDLCKPLGISVEAELGHVGGHTKHPYADSGDSLYTDVEEAARFAGETGVDCLAVAIGTVHGVYKDEPRLGFDRLQALRAAVDTPFALHGCSGITEEDYQKVVRLGIQKMNVFTEIWYAMKRRMLDVLDRKMEIDDKAVSIINAIADAAEFRMRAIGSAGKAASCMGACDEV